MDNKLATAILHLSKNDLGGFKKTFKEVLDTEMKKKVDSVFENSESEFLEDVDNITEDVLKNVASNKDLYLDVFEDFQLNSEDAETLLLVYNSLNESNRVDFMAKLNSNDSESILDLIEWCEEIKQELDNSTEEQEDDD